MRYLISDQFVPHINAKNPLGKGGALALAYASLCKQMIFGTDRIVTPREFVMGLRHLAPQFQYGEQHDSQEFVAYLLDSLHEDLNLVVEKPYTSLRDSHGRDDHDVAAEAWDAHTNRNKSTLVDLFQGQYKSTLQCPDCEHTSTTFDPFLSLSLPIPGAYDRDIRCSFFPANGARPTRFTLTVNARATFVHFKEKLVERK
jgi:ubiquitin C-terminal hydrolase